MMKGITALFLRFFPPPQFISLPAVGVDVSDTSLKYMQFTKDGALLQLGAWGDLKIPDGVVEQGVVKDVSALGKVIAEVKKVTKTEFVRLSLPEERAYLFETTVKRSLGSDEVYSALEFGLEQNIPVSPRDAEFDYTPVLHSEHGADMHVVVTAYTKETVLAYYDACKIAGVTPLSFEVEAQALARAVVPQGDAGVSLIVDFGKTRTGVGIVENGILMFTSTVDQGGRHLDEALLTVYPHATEDELITMKNEHGVLRSPEFPLVRDALLVPIATLKSELLARLSYWSSRPEGATHGVTRVILCGGIANLAGLTDFLSEALGIKTEQADVWQNAFSIERDVPPITRRYSYGYATAVGLALGSFMHDVV